MTILNMYGPAETSLWVSRRNITYKEKDKCLCIKDVLPCSKKEKELLSEFNDTAADYPKEKCVHELFEAQVEIIPDRIAVVAVNKTLTYRELNDEANRIASSLLSKGIGKGDIVAVILPRTSHLIPAIIGVLKAGAAYMPIDPTYPKERIDYLLTESQAKFRIDESNIESLCINDYADNPDIPVSMLDYFCALHTSGSTGKPKLTVLTQQNLLNFLYANLDFWKDVEAVITVTIVTFDIFMQDTLLSLALGKKVLLASNDQIYNQLKFEKMFENEENVMFFSTPTKLTSYIKQSKTAGFLKKIISLIVGGEVFTDELYDLIIEKIKTQSFHNDCGQAETTGVSYTDSLPPPQKIPNQYIQCLRTCRNIHCKLSNTWVPPQKTYRLNQTKKPSEYSTPLVLQNHPCGQQKSLKIYNIYGPAETAMWSSVYLETVQYQQGENI